MEITSMSYEKRFLAAISRDPQCTMIANIGLPRYAGRISAIEQGRLEPSDFDKPEAYLDGHLAITRYVQKQERAFGFFTRLLRAGLS